MLTNRRAGLFTGLVLFLLALDGFVHGKSLEEWRKRSIYQVVTDRFARKGGWGDSGCDLKKYCGGNFRGIISRLGYIKKLGFDAIWISPVVEQTPDGYHGYWAKNLYEINPEFGTKEDLKELVRRAHKRGIWVMVDVVGNHMGYPADNDVSPFKPFDRWEHYHDCNGCDQYCNINNFNSEWMVEHCRLAGLPDLNQDNPYVRQKLLEWIRDLVQEYGFDGIRIDTVPEVKKEFWRDFVDASGVFAIGENFDGHIERIAKYQGGDCIDSMLDYPMYFTLRDVFQRLGDMTLIPYRRGQQKPFFDDIRKLGVFVDNHDNPRFLADQGDESLYKNALTYVLLGEGIPIVYYGSEQYYSGGADPQNREPLWNSGFGKNGDLFQFIAALNKHRRSVKIWDEEHVELHASKNCYVFSRGSTIVALTNVGTGTWESWCKFNAGHIVDNDSTFAYVYPRGGYFEQNSNGDINLKFYMGMPVVLRKVSGKRTQRKQSEMLQYKSVS